MATEVYRIQRNASRDRLVLAAVAFAGIAPVFMFAMFYYHFGLLEQLGARWPFLLAIAAVGLVGIFSMVHQRNVHARARLLMDDGGLRLVDDRGQPMRLPFGGRAQMAWDEIAQVALMERLGVVQLRRKGAFATPLVLEVAPWVPEAEWRRDAAPARKKPDLRSAALYRALERRGVFAADKSDPRAAAVNFDLAKHPATRLALGGMALLVLYGFVDGLLVPEAWAEWNLRYVAPHAAIGIVGAVLGYVALGAARKPQPVPGQVAGFLALLLGMTVAFASWQGLIRVNQAFGGEQVAATYHRNGDCDALLPADAKLPVIEYTHQAKDYWCSIPAGQAITVPVRAGLGGLYQVDLRRHTEAIRDFRRARGR